MLLLLLLRIRRRRRRRKKWERQQSSRRGLQQPLSFCRSIVSRSASSSSSSSPPPPPPPPISSPREWKIPLHNRTFYPVCLWTTARKLDFSKPFFFFVHSFFFWTFQRMERARARALISLFGKMQRTIGHWLCEYTVEPPAAEAAAAAATPFHCILWQWKLIRCAFICVASGGHKLTTRAALIAFLLSLFFLHPDTNCESDQFEIRSAVSCRTETLHDHRSIRSSAGAGAGAGRGWAL